jgi:hypothetical protein
MRFLFASTLGPTLVLSLWVGLVRPAAAQTVAPSYHIVIANGPVLKPISTTQ